MGPMQSGLNFTDRIVKYMAKWAERKTKPASPSRGHVILPYLWFLIISFLYFIFWPLKKTIKHFQTIQEVLEKHTKLFFWFAENAEI